MRGLFTKKAFTLQAGQAVSGTAHRAHTLRVTQGRVWITVEGISHDYWLHAGDTFTAAPGLLIVAEADHAETRIECTPAIQWMNALKLLMKDAASHVASRFVRGRTVGVSLKRHGACNEGC